MAIPEKFEYMLLRQQRQTVYCTARILHVNCLIRNHPEMRGMMPMLTGYDLNAEF
jgi:hypothetical protein